MMSAIPEDEFTHQGVLDFLCNCPVDARTSNTSEFGVLKTEMKVARGL